MRKFKEPAKIMITGNKYMSRVMRKSDCGFPPRPDTKVAVQPQKIARACKFQIYEVEGLYYLCSENKDTDQLCSYLAADLRLCIGMCKKLFFLIMQLT